MKTLLKAIMIGGVLGIAAPVASIVNAQESYPNRPIEVVVPFAPGGTTDVMGRVLAEQLSQRLGVPAPVLNHAGGSGMVGAAEVVRSAPDGYKLLFATMLASIYEHLYPSVPFDSMTDLAPVSLVATTPYILAVPTSSPFETLEDFIAHAEANPGALTYAASVVGSPQHLATERLKAATSIDVMYIPYGGSAEAVPDILSGRVDAGMDSVSTFQEHIRAGTLRALAVTSAERIDLFPDVPTIAEAGVEGFSADGWFAVFAPAGTDSAIIERLSAEIDDILAQPEIKERYASFGAVTQGGTPDVLADTMSTYNEVLGEVITNLDLKLN